MRVRILCEDRLSERFLRRLCELNGIEVLDTEVAPKGGGSASQWVAVQYPRMVKQRRSQNFQTNLGVLVHIDGDQVGVQARKATLDGRLQAMNLAPRGAAETVATLVPTWCTETWLLHLTGIAQPPETCQLKRGPDRATYQAALNQLEALGAAGHRQAAEAWSSLNPAPPSLLDGRTEAARVGIH